LNTTVLCDRHKTSSKQEATKVTGFDWDEVKRQWEGTKQVFDGKAVYHPASGQYVPIPPEAVPEPLPPDVLQPGPNSTEGRLAHLQMLVATGAITQAEAAEQRRRILQGI
jgi:hypothetical protein